MGEETRALLDTGRSGVEYKEISAESDRRQLIGCVLSICNETKVNLMMLGEAKQEVVYC